MSLIAIALAAASLEAFAPVKAAVDDSPALHCTADRAWCAEVSRDVDQNTYELHVFAGRPTAPTTPVLSQPVEASEDNATLEIWPRIVRLADGGLLIGVVDRRSTGYSGGGASASELRLIRVTPGEATGPVVLSLPLAAAISIRACFGRADERARRGACHDEYDFSAELTLAPGEAAGLPKLVYQAKATTFPGDVSRNADSTTRPPLRARDLVHVTDARCSYRRVLAYDEAAMGYEADMPLPDCGEYTDP